VVADRRRHRPGSGDRHRCSGSTLSAWLRPYSLEHAAKLEQQFEQHGPGEAMVTLTLNDDGYLRSYNGARLDLGLPLPPEG
jgi:hypothetical protein